MSIKKNLELVNKKIGNAAGKSARKPEEVTLVGVSKRISNELITECYKSGLLNFGENYAQDFRDKYELLNPEYSKIIWHFIGHLQKNKIKYVIGKVGLIHSLNSITLAEEMNNRAEKLGIEVKMLIEINTSGEKTKSGITFEESDKLLQRATQLNNIKVTGFMTMAPYFDESEMARPYFKQLKDYRDNTVISFPDAKELSMGMSEDFEIAVEEGSTLVRIGTAIFGPRN